ncbi:MAG: exonuclease domain-containing protein [Clostridia bacterium]|nr:exonuclease domain-containing protein [Clostridia bacterium]
MYYVILDLEWNNTYGRKTKSFINEIIEIGAVMLDENLNEVSRYSSLIRSQIGKKLRGSVKQLTHITNEDLDNGIPFTKAVSQFRRWIGSRDNTVITWGDGDIRVLIENCRYLNGIEIVPFLSNYTDLQAYFHSIFDTPPSRQVGLSTAAELLGIDVDAYSHHRALDDSLLTADIFRKIFNPETFPSYIRPCTRDFYSRLSFKPYVIGNINHPLVDKSKLTYTCETCGRPAKQLTEWRFVSRHFRALFYCPHCDQKIKVGVSFKKMYDRVEVKKTSVLVVEQKQPDGADETDASPYGT